jgi:hypothetical protein
MAWVVDTCIVLDLVTTNVAMRRASASCLWKLSGAGLVVCPVTYAELGPAFGGDPTVVDQFLSSLSIQTREPWTEADTLAAHRLWNDHQQRKRAGQAPRRPIADVLIAAFALRFDGIITRNTDDFHRIAPALVVVEP